jgi:hypothetical protein
MTGTSLRARSTPHASCVTLFWRPVCELSSEFRIGPSLLALEPPTPGSWLLIRLSRQSELSVALKRHQLATAGTTGKEAFVSCRLELCTALLIGKRLIMIMGISTSGGALCGETSADSTLDQA